MTPAQEAREYAAKHGFSIKTVGRRYQITHTSAPLGWIGSDVGGYPAALNAMKRYMQEQELAKTTEELEKVSAIVGKTFVPTRIVGCTDSARDFPFEDDAITRKLAKYCSIGSPEWYARNPWRIIGAGYFPMAYATRSDALKTVRRIYAGEPGISIVYVGA